MNLRSTIIIRLLTCSLWLIARLPDRLVRASSSLVGILAPRLRKRDHLLIASNVERVYKLPRHSSFAKSFENQVFRSQWTILIETLQSTMASKDPNRLDGLNHLGETMHSLLAHKRGLIIVTAHIGSWEFVARYAAQASGKRFNALAKPSKLPEMTYVLNKLRDRMNTAVLWTDSKNLLRDMLKLLKAGECLGFVMDQKPEGRIGPSVNFLGQTTEFVSGPAKLAMRQSSPVLAVFCVRTGPHQYRLLQKVVAPADHGIDDETILTQKMADAIEEAIRLYPEQWIWNYKRWRSETQTPLATSS